jgi:hypothetical protein
VEQKNGRAPNRPSSKIQGMFFSNCSRFKKYAKSEVKEIEESIVPKIYVAERFRDPSEGENRFCSILL